MSEDEPRTSSTRFATGDKVVCIDDRHQRHDMADTPDGLLVRGRVYCVAGISECGGIRLTGLRAISHRTGRETGFDPGRFCGLAEFQQRRAEGWSPNTDGDESAGCGLPDWRQHYQPFECPEVEGLEAPKPLVRDAVTMLEYWHDRAEAEEASLSWLELEDWRFGGCRSVQEELLALHASPLRVPLMNLSTWFWLQPLRYRHPTVLFCRELSVGASVLFHWCMGARVFCERVVKGRLEDQDFPRLTSAAGELAHGAIRFCDASDPDIFLRVLLEAHAGFEHAVCDWRLNEAEEKRVRRVSSCLDIQMPRDDAFGDVWETRNWCA